VVYAFIDSWVRAFVLREVISSHESFENLTAAPQIEADGTTFYFMQDITKKASIDALCGFISTEPSELN
jgi:hypothetical protein